MNKKAILATLLFAAMFIILIGCKQTEKMRILEEDKMKTITIDFTDCRYMIELYEEMDKALGFPKGYGKNLDALWDCLTGFIETPVEVHFKGIECLPKDLQQEALKIFQVFVEAEEKYGEVQPVSD